MLYEVITLGYTALAITDECSMAGIVQALRAQDASYNFV